MLEIARIDAGPAAIALAPRGDAAALAEALGLEEKDGRVLLRERIDDPEARYRRLDALFRDALE